MSVSMNASLESLVPHSRSMVLIDEPYDAGDNWANASVRISEDCMFYKPGFGVPTWVGVEYMAQTIALYAGIRATQRGKPITVGFLLGTTRYSAELDFFRLGSALRVTANESWRDNQMAVHDCTIEDQRGATIAVAELKVFKPKDPIAFFQEHKNEP